MLCNHCKTEVKKGAKFCKNCGKKIELQVNKKIIEKEKIQLNERFTKNTVGIAIFIAVIAFVFVGVGIYEYYEYSKKQDQYDDFLQKESDVYSYYQDPIFIGWIRGDLPPLSKECREVDFLEYLKLEDSLDSINISRRQAMRLIDLGKCSKERNERRLKSYKKMKTDTRLLHYLAINFEEENIKEIAENIVSNWKEIINSAIKEEELNIKFRIERRRLAEEYLDYLEGYTDFNTFSRRRLEISDSIWEMDDKYPDIEKRIEKIKKRKKLTEELKEQMELNLGEKRIGRFIFELIKRE